MYLKVLVVWCCQVRKKHKSNLIKTIFTWSKTRALDGVPGSRSTAKNSIAVNVLASDAQIPGEAGAGGHRGRRQGMASHREVATDPAVRIRVVAAVVAVVLTPGTRLAVDNLGHVLDEGGPVCGRPRGALRHRPAQFAHIEIGVLQPFVQALPLSGQFLAKFGQN